MTTPTEVELLRKKIRIEAEKQQSQETASAVEAQPSAAVEPIDGTDILLSLAIFSAVVITLMVGSIWLVARLLRAAVRGTSRAWHEGAQR